MSTKEETAVSMEEARRLAMEAVRFNLGTYPRLGKGEFEEEELQFIFPVLIKSPKLILDSSGENAKDLRYLDPIEVGEVTVDGSSKELEYPTKGQVKKEIRRYEQELNEAIQKALVRASGANLSHLPFPENQYSPIQDILSEVILNNEIFKEDIAMMDKYSGKEKYQKHIDDLIELDLLKQEEEVFRSGDVLNNIQKKSAFRGHRIEGHHDSLNAALGVYFEHNIGEFDMIKKTLGPYLALAGFYYRRALELDELPTIREEDLRKGIKTHYDTGRKEQMKLFKMSRYLIQLEDVGVLESVYHNGERYWVGDSSTFDRLKTAANELGPITNLFSPSINEQTTLGTSD